jgi:hypothetical protein
MRINVAQKDIDDGVRESCAACPVALAIRRKIRQGGIAVADRYMVVSGVQVTSSHTLIGTSSYSNPPEARAFIVAFDSGETVEPFSFDLPIEEPHGQ